MNTKPIHIVLGGNGVAGRETVRALVDRGIEPLSLGRTPSHTPGARSVIADLLSPGAVTAALAGADVAYLTAGLPYSAGDWEAMWLKMLENTINACIEHGSLLVYLDNVYAYGRVEGPMTESTPIRPASRKGRVRADALEMLDEAHSRGLVHTIGRSADFYGPGATTSVVNSFIVDRILTGKKPTWFFDSTQPHSLTYTPDVGDGLAILGTDPRSRGHVWHLPTAAPALTGEQYMAIAANGTGSIQTMSTMTMRIGALFNKSARETLEMAYQYTAPYDFDSSKFETTFGVHATPYKEGLGTTLQASRSV